ncbi:MAG: serine/threonine protein kinase [Rhodobacteraceae bacterium CG17_big_fil_post_rev_8_21_14_2_50_63_15]|nr:serine/threonine protein kinase [Roseovarius sp.]PIV78703.1 MAG: serine/threonine protein kinase [Rhodobacteraceae bacterium CG17_big_fil_post_rev_8_21_14_2_50_63_15]
MIQMVATPDAADTDDMQIGTTLLNGQFLIKSRLQTGGFGIAYVARDSLDRQVVIKECFPSGLCIRRNGRVRPIEADFEAQFEALKRQFIREARQMAKLIHPNIVAVHQVFEENNTAYMALDQVIGVDLLTLLEEQPERITNRFLHAVLSQMLQAIGYTHEHGLLHRDISPDNILVDEGNHFTLIDFGAALELRVQPAGNQSMIVAVKDGYSPNEFYLTSETHDFSSDLYSLGATLYHLITGSAPPDCQSRLAAMSSGAQDTYLPLASSDFDYDYNILVTVDRALELLQENRFGSASAWISALETTSRVRPVARQAPLPDPYLEVKIAQIVETTNKLLERKKRDAKQTAGAALSKQAVRPEPRKIVDIFGNRIDDLDAWQAEQEREIQARKRMHKAPDDNLQKSGIGEIGPVGKSVINRVIARPTPVRHLAPSSHS